jgi:hypothetical protein
VGWGLEELEAQRGYISVSDDEYESESDKKDKGEFRDFRKNRKKKAEGDDEMRGQTGDFDEGFWGNKKVTGDGTAEGMVEVPDVGKTGK